MTRSFIVHTIDQMGGSERAALLDRLHPVHVEATGGTVSRRRLADYVFAPADRKRVGELLDGQGRTIAFVVNALTVMDLLGQQRGIYRPSGFARHGAGFSPYMACLSLQCWTEDQRWRPDLDFYTVGHIVQPVPYVFFRRFVERVYPSEGLETPERIARLRDALIEALGEEVVRAPWVVRAYAGHEVEVPDAGTHPLLAEFERLNPGWQQGEALFYMLPMDAANMAPGSRLIARLAFGSTQLVSARDASLNELATARRAC